MNVQGSKSAVSRERDPGNQHYSPEHEAQGIVRSFVEVFAVGPFRYSKLEDAIAQSRRDRLGT